jgi:hypothetical protein
LLQGGQPGPALEVRRVRAAGADAGQRRAKRRRDGVHPAPFRPPHPTTQLVLRALQLCGEGGLASLQPALAAVTSAVAARGGGAGGGGGGGTRQADVADLADLFSRISVHAEQVLQAAEQADAQAQAGGGAAPAGAWGPAAAHPQPQGPQQAAWPAQQQQP